MSAGSRKVWITRAQPGADATAARVAALGLAPIVEPLLEVRLLRPRVDLADIAALAFTSANGARAFAELSAERRLPVWAVGEATAAAARATGFLDVRAAGGDVAALAEAIAASPSAPGAVLHPAAREPAGDLAGELAVKGVVARTLPVYETTPSAAADDPDAAEKVDLVLLHSPRAARLAAGLLARRPRPALRAACLSPAVAAALGPVAEARAASTPDEAALLRLLQEMAG